MTQSDPDQCCHEYREDIPWLVNGTLSDPAAAAVHEHIGHCSDCRADLELHEEMRATSLGNAVVPMMPTIQAADVIGGRGHSRAQRSRNRRFPSQLTAMAASIAILGVALLLSFYPDRGVEETNQLFETATATESTGGIDYIMQLRFEIGLPDAERDKIAAQLAGIVKWNIDERGDYEVYVQLDAPSFRALQEYEERAAALAGVQSAKFTALQLPMR